MEGKRNVLFIINHDTSRRFGCYGNTHARTPSIDRLASRGLVFEQHYCNYALCGPSRANIFTGCRPETTRRINNDEFYPGFRERMGAGFATLPEHFKNHGYFTQSLNQVLHGYETDDPAWSVPQWWPEFPAAPSWASANNAPRFRHWVTPESFELMRQRYEALKAKGIDPEAGINCKRWRGPAVEKGNPENGSYYNDDGPTEKAIEVLGEHGRSKLPFFLCVGYEIGHTPWCTSAQDWDMYEPEELPQPVPPRPPEGAPGQAMGSNEPGQFYTQDLYDRLFHPDAEQTRELLHGAYAAMSAFDAQVGRIVAAVAGLGLRENTIVVLTTDHGFSLGEHGKWGKGNLWEQSLAVPLIVVDPDGAPGRTRAMTEHVDIYPTLAQLCGLPCPDFLEGTSAAPLFEEPDRPWKQAVFAAQGLDARSVRTARYRYSDYCDQQDKVAARELYDYRSDPHQTKNLDGDPAYDEVERRLRHMLKEGWRACVPAQSHSQPQ